MALENTDYQSLRELSNSRGWNILVEELTARKNAIETVILSPNLDDMLGTDDLQKLFNLLSYKKAERQYIIELMELPGKLLSTKIK